MRSLSVLALMPFPPHGSQVDVGEFLLVFQEELIVRLKSGRWRLHFDLIAGKIFMIKGLLCSYSIFGVNL